MAMIDDGETVPESSNGWGSVDVRDLLAQHSLALGAGSPTDVGRSWRLPTEHPNPITLSGGIPDFPTLPVDGLRQALDSALTSDPREALDYGGRLGFEGLRSILADRQGRIEGMTLRSENFLIHNGSSGSIDAICRAFIDPGDVIIVESPTFSGSVRTMRGYRADVMSVPMDDHGISMDGVARAIAEVHEAGGRVKGLYTVADFHNPTGIVMSPERKSELVELCARHRIMIIEDAAYAELYYGQSQPRSIYSVAGGQGVFRLGSFSKSIATGLRVGWIQGREDFIDGFAPMRFDMGNGPLMQMALADFVERGKLDEHLDMMRPIYAEKCEVLSASLAEHSQDRVQFRQPDGGFFLWLECLDADARQVAKAAADEGLIFPLGAVFFLNREDDDTSHLRLAFSNASLDQLADAGRRLGVALQRVGAK